MIVWPFVFFQKPIVSAPVFVLQSSALAVAFCPVSLIVAVLSTFVHVPGLAVTVRE